MVAVEHFFKFTLLIPLLDKHVAQTSFAFEQHVLGRYGACTEVVTDQSSECNGEFTALLVDTLINHIINRFDHIMPGEHDPLKYEAVVLAGHPRVEVSGVENLFRAVRMDIGCIFLPWQLSSEAHNLLRSHGCTVRASVDAGSLAPTHKNSFVEARSEGVLMEVIGSRYGCCFCPRFTYRLRIS